MPLFSFYTSWKHQKTRNLKAAEISPTFTKNVDLAKENYRPLNVLAHMSKVFERVIYIQVESFMEDK